MRDERDFAELRRARSVSTSWRSTVFTARGVDVDDPPVLNVRLKSSMSVPP